MANKHLLLFSSDSSPLYKADIFRVLALPEGHTIQFRYAKNFVPENFFDCPAILKNRDAVIFFLAGNDPEKEVGNPNLTWHPIRSCKVKDSFIDEGTGQIFLILELGKFIDCQISKTEYPNSYLPKTLVAEGLLESLVNRTWFECVETIEHHFEGILFYHINSIMGDNSPVEASYSPARYHSFYVLNEESEYYIECSAYDRAMGNSLLTIECKSPEISLSNEFEAGVGALLDTKRFPLTTRSISSQSAPAQATFFTGASAASRDLNRVNIYLRVRRKPEKPEKFGFYTALAAVGLGISNGGLKDMVENFSCCDMMFRLLGLAILGIAASQLYDTFNKTDPKL